MFAAASLKNALDDIGAAWTAEAGKEAVVSYAASSALAKQIEEGAPADVFISADVAWMAYLSERDLVKKDTVVELLGNRLVLVAPADSGAGGDRAGLRSRGPPRRRQARHGERRCGAGGQVRQGGADHARGLGQRRRRVAQAENVRAALALVSTGEAPLGIVYETDANADPAVKVIGAFPEDSHAPIVYPAAETVEAKSAEAGAYHAPTSRARRRGGAFRGAGFHGIGAGDELTTDDDRMEWLRLSPGGMDRGPPLHQGLEPGRRWSACPSGSSSRICWPGGSFPARRCSTGWCTCR